MNDEQLLLRWRGGDTSAGRELFGRHYESVTRFFINKVPEEDVPDLIQGTFLACLEGAAERFSGRGSMRGYLFGVAYRVLYKYFDRRRRERSTLDFSLASVRDLGATPSTALAAHLEHQRVLETLQHLPIDYQVVLELHYWEGMTAAEIGASLDLPTGTVLTRMRRGRHRMRRLMDEPSSPMPAAPRVTTGMQ